MDKQQRATTLLLSHLPKTELYEPLRSAIANMSVMMFNDPDSVFAGAALRAIAKALPDEQPAQGEVEAAIWNATYLHDTLVPWSEVKPGTQHHKRVIAAAQAVARLLAPPTGPAVEELVAALEYVLAEEISSPAEKRAREAIARFKGVHHGA